MRATLVYDLPTRLFHVLFAGFFIAAFAISNLVDDDSARFPLHMLAGLGMVSVIVLRLAWSLVGTRHARLGDLALNPAQLIAYFKDMFTSGGRRWVGHNPASSLAAVAMVGLGLGLGATGYLMATGAGGDSLKDAHELMANAFLAVALLHVGGVLAHVLRHRDHLATSMVTGRKQALPVDEESVRPAPVAGLVFVVLTGLSMGYLLQHYDAQARTLDLFGTTMQLGEHEDDHESGDTDGDRRHRD
ncbi:cytochrome b/b6 domain-containing protein [Luteimonas sp. MC1750]|uniref:cytochrome b/b6 domain-containing protein n=1 Tax=Luteimonas sp. MC1750 TaxID=2799326 RepID=UPI0018F06180|nr:cytochrome b/b6 domain-containing protein [Luteimonas sp. MC1750]MBJ6984681.1 cytochrome b/b6 domain-containing protein [Luteimonas sp. MC1750]QQO04722.1 cytochrome b/b6 domain-containing protein [Luteimonas sp. MC1750]